MVLNKPFIKLTSKDDPERFYWVNVNFIGDMVIGYGYINEDKENRIPYTSVKMTYGYKGTKEIVVAETPEQIIEMM